MNSRAFTLSLIIAGFAMYMVTAYINGKEAEYKEKFGVEKVVVAAKVDIQELDLLDDTNVTVIKVPSKFMAPSVYLNREEVFNKFAAVPILKDEQITAPRVLNPGGKAGLARQVSVGKRAISIAINEAQAVTRLIRPGDRVDVIATLDYAGGQKDKSRTKTILQDVYVLATGLNVTNSIPIIGVETPKAIRLTNLSTYSAYTTITVEVDPFDAQKLIYIKDNLGQLNLALRNNNDRFTTRVRPTGIYDVLVEDRNEAKKFFMNGK